MSLFWAKLGSKGRVLQLLASRPYLYTTCFFIRRKKGPMHANISVSICIHSQSVQLDKPLNINSPMNLQLIFAPSSQPCWCFFFFFPGPPGILDLCLFPPALDSPWTLSPSSSHTWLTFIPPNLAVTHQSLLLQSPRLFPTVFVNLKEPDLDSFNGPYVVLLW